MCEHFIDLLIVYSNIVVLACCDELLIVSPPAQAPVVEFSRRVITSFVKPWMICFLARRGWLASKELHIFGQDRYPPTWSS